MRKYLTDGRAVVTITKRETETWAIRPGSAWPCSTLAGHSVTAEFDSGGLVDLLIDGKGSGPVAESVDGAEFNAIISDYLAPHVPADHPLRSILVTSDPQPLEPETVEVRTERTYAVYVGYCVVPVFTGTRSECEAYRRRSNCGIIERYR